MKIPLIFIPALLCTTLSAPASAWQLKLQQIVEVNGVPVKAQRAHVKRNDQVVFTLTGSHGNCPQTGAVEEHNALTGHKIWYIFLDEDNRIEHAPGFVMNGHNMTCSEDSEFNEFDKEGFVAKWTFKVNHHFIKPGTYVFTIAGEGEVPYGDVYGDDYRINKKVPREHIRNNAGNATLGKYTLFLDVDPY